MYNHDESEKMISKNFNILIFQISVIFLVTLLVSIIAYFRISKNVYMAQHDQLTGLKNRAVFEEDLKNVLNKKSSSHVLMMIDLDNFKLVNDTLGHDEGDYVLKLVSDILKEVVKDTSLSVYRLGGDEFIIILPHTTEEQAIQLAEKINHSLEKALAEHKDYDELEVSASIGIALYNKENQVNEKELRKQADEALYKVKNKGKSGFYVYDQK